MVVKGRQPSGDYAECVHFDQSTDAVGCGRGDRTLDLFLDGRPEAIRGQLSHALKSPTPFDEAGGAPDAALHDERTRTVRPGEGGISAGIDTEHPGSSGGGQMKRSRIIGDHKVGFAGERGELEQPGASAKIQHGQRRQQS